VIRHREENISALEGTHVGTATCAGLQAQQAPEHVVQECCVSNQDATGAKRHAADESDSQVSARMENYIHAMKRSLWVARLIVSDATKQKLASRHGLDWRDVNQAIIGASDLRYRLGRRSTTRTPRLSRGRDRRPDVHRRALRG
jgi:hypothetical protein